MKNRIKELEEVLNDEQTKNVNFAIRMGKEIQRLKEIVRIQGEALKFYAEGDGRRIVEAPSGKHWIQEYGCGCCTQSYQVDPDGTIGMMDCELDNVAGWTAREAIAQVEKLAKPEDGK